MGLEQHENEIIEFTFLGKRFNNILLYFINSVTMYIKLKRMEKKETIKKEI